MRVLMTGGYGCIGSWVAKQLVESGQEVWVFDLKEDTHRVDLLLDAEQGERVHFVAGDVSDPDAVRAAVETLGATHLLHLAGLQTPTCRANPILGAKVNVIGTLAVFEAAVALKGQVERVVYASSAAVHGPAAASSGPLADEVRLAPLSHYGAYKVCNELNARVYWLDNGVTSVGLRPWTVYGVGRDFGMTSEPTKAIKAVAAGRSYHISYGGSQDLQYVGDVAGTFVRASGRALSGGRCVQCPRRGGADRVVRVALASGCAGGRIAGDARRSSVAHRLRPGRFPTRCRARPDPAHSVARGHRGDLSAVRNLA